MRKSLLAIVGLLFVAIVVSACGSSSPTTPSISPLTPPVPSIKVESYIGMSQADPSPLPSGRPQFFCGFPVAVSGIMRASVQALPGGTLMQMYLIKKYDGETLYCGPEMATCPGAIGTMDFMDSATNKWGVVDPVSYCIVVRNRTEVKQVVNGGLVFEHY